MNKDYSPGSGQDSVGPALRDYGCKKASGKNQPFYTQTPKEMDCPEKSREK